MSQPVKPTNPAEPIAAPPGFVLSSAEPSAPVSTVAQSSAGTSATAALAGPEPAPDSLAVDPQAMSRIERLVADYLDSILSLEPGGPEYGRGIAAMGQLGERDFIATSALSGRLLDRRFLAMRGLLAAKAPLARQLADLRKTASGLDPASVRLGGRDASRDELREFDRYFERFARAQPRLEKLLDSLSEGRIALEQDNAAILTEQASLSTEMETLRQYAYLASRLDVELTARLAEIEVSNPDRARRLSLDVLTVVRRRRQEILTQLAIVTQGYAALKIVEDNNADVIGAVASAIATTTAALRTAALVAGAAASQRAALGQLEAARLAASTMSEQAAALEAGVTGPGGRVDMLRQAWDEVYAALDRVEAQKAQVLKTIASADRELTRPKSVDAEPR